jgi:hypothetical protein
MFSPDAEEAFAAACQRVHEQMANIIKAQGPPDGHREAIIICLAHTREAACLMGNVMPREMFIEFIENLMEKMLQTGLREEEGGVEASVTIEVKPRRRRAKQ